MLLECVRFHLIKKEARTENVHSVKTVVNATLGNVQSLINCRSQASRCSLIKKPTKLPQWLVIMWLSRMVAVSCFVS